MKNSHGKEVRFMCEENNRNKTNPAPRKTSQSLKISIVKSLGAGAKTLGIRTNILN